MRITFLLGLACLVLGAGCGQKSQTPAVAATNAAAPSGGSVLTAPVDYLGGVARAQQSAIKTADTAALNQAIQLFNAQEGRNPKDLQELVQAKLIGQVPPAPRGMKLDYDPQAGTVKVLPQ